MTTATISITRALTELKGLDTKIKQAIASGSFVAIAVGEKNRSEAAVSELTTNVRASYDKVDGLITRRNAIKSAIIKSNAQTEITFRGAKLTVAEAIELRTNTKAYKEQLLTALLNQHRSVANEKVLSENRVRDAVAKVESQLFSREPGTSDRTAELAMITAHQEKISGATVVDPLGILEKIEALRTEITDFDVELDSLLSESNAITQITV